MLSPKKDTAQDYLSNSCSNLSENKKNEIRDKQNKSLLIHNSDFNNTSEAEISQNLDSPSNVVRKGKKRFSLVHLAKAMKSLDQNIKLFDNACVVTDKDYLKYTDKSFENYVDDQIKISKMQKKMGKGIGSNSKFFTYEVAKYFQARIPNNYFDAMQIIGLTSELIFESPQITEWDEEDVIKWFESLNLNNYSHIIRQHGINGMSLLKMNVFEYKDILGINDIKEIKLLMKSVDFLRIFVKLKLDFYDYLEYEKNENEKNEQLLNATAPQPQVMLPVENINNYENKQTTPINALQQITGSVANYHYQNSHKNYFVENDNFANYFKKEKSSKDGN